jgi:hypothetical protein
MRSSCGPVVVGLLGALVGLGGGRARLDAISSDGWLGVGHSVRNNRLINSRHCRSSWLKWNPHQGCPPAGLSAIYRIGRLAPV